MLSLSLNQYTDYYLFSHLKVAQNQKFVFLPEPHRQASKSVLWRKTQQNTVTCVETLKDTGLIKEKFKLENVLFRENLMKK
jgi:hypothetical protein